MKLKDVSSFTERLKYIIYLVGSADKLAKNAGITAAAISQYLSGTDPTRKKLIALADAAGVNVQWLATGEGLMRNDGWHQFKIAALILIIDILEDYKNELREKFTSEKRNELIDKLYECSSDNFPASEKTKKDIKNVIIDVFDLLPTIERMIEKEKDRKHAQNIVKSVFEKILPEKKAKKEAEELIGARISRLHLK